MAIDKKILSRIRKLLALATSPNAHEAASAFEAARKLMTEHGLNADDLKLADIEEHAARDQAGITPPYYLMGLIVIVTQTFGVKAVRSAGRIESSVTFYGQAARAELAAYSYVVLARQLAKARRLFAGGLSKRLKRSTKVARADAFCEGWVIAAHEHVRRLALSEHEQALLAEYSGRRWGNALTPAGYREGGKTRDQDNSWRVGRAAGRDIRLDRPVGADEPTLKLAG